MKTKKVKVCHNVHADENDELNFGWHDGHSLLNSETVAFKYKQQWYASNTKKDQNKVLGPFESKEEALSA